MMKQTFVLNDRSRPELLVVRQVSKKFDSMTIQLSQVVDEKNYTLGYNTVTFGMKWVYEEIDHNDFVQYARYMGLNQVEAAYPWALSKK